MTPDPTSRPCEAYNLVARCLPSNYPCTVAPTRGLILTVVSSKDGIQSVWHMEDSLAREIVKKVGSLVGVSASLMPYDDGQPALEAG